VIHEAAIERPDLLSHPSLVTMLELYLSRPAQAGSTDRPSRRKPAPRADV